MVHTAVAHESAYRTKHPVPHTALSGPQPTSSLQRAPGVARLAGTQGELPTCSRSTTHVVQASGGNFITGAVSCSRTQLHLTTECTHAQYVPTSCTNRTAPAGQELADQGQVQISAAVDVHALPQAARMFQTRLSSFKMHAQTARILGMCSSMPCYLPIWQATTPMHTDEDDTRTAWHTLFAILQSIAQTLQLQCRPCSSCTTQHSMHSPLAISLPALLSNITPQFCDVQSCRSVCTANPLVCNKDGHHPLRTSNQHSSAPKITIVHGGVCAEHCQTAAAHASRLACWQRALSSHRQHTASGEQLLTLQNKNQNMGRTLRS